MNEPTTINMEGKDFVINKLPILKAICLDKTLVTLVLPGLSGIDFASLAEDGGEEDFNVETLFTAVSEGLSKLTDENLQKFFVDLFTCVQVIVPGKPVQELNANNINHIFTESLFNVYKIAFEVMRHNKFAPFALVEGGNVTEKISGYMSQKKKPKTKQNSSETSESTLENSNGSGRFGV